MTQNGQRFGRVTSEVTSRIKDFIKKERIGPGQYIPSIRKMAAEYGVSKVTIERAMRVLESDGVVVSSSRRGYRVPMAAGAPETGLPTAYVYSGQFAVGEGSDEAASQTILSAFQRFVGRENWSLLVVNGENRSAGEIVSQLMAARVCGVVMDALDGPVISRLGDAGIPVVVVDNIALAGEADTVVQDGFVGGVLAADWIARQGYRSIGWLGPDVADCDPEISERYGGVVAGLARAGLGLSSNHRASAPLGRLEEAAARAGELLARPDRPTVFLALWQEMTMALAGAAAGMGLRVGEDFELIGWCTREEYEAGFLAKHGLRPEQPMLVWSVAEMASLALARLAQRRELPDLPRAAIRVGVSLVGNAGRR